METLKLSLDDLRSSTETRELMKKLESIHPQFLYNCFSNVFTGFGTLQEALDTCQSLSNNLIDDGCFYMFEEETETAKSMRLRFEEATGKPKEPTMTTVITTEEKGIYCDQEMLLRFIDDEEKKDIQNINNFVSLRRRLDGETLSIKSIEMLGDLSHLEGFSVENMMELPKEVKEYFKIKL